MTYHDYDCQLTLDKLNPWMSKETYEWIKADDEERLELQEQIAAERSINLFGDDDDSNDGTTRIQTWTSSLTNPDGIGGFQNRNDQEDDGVPTKDSDAVSIIFILSDSHDGFGDVVWASSRHIANILANPNKCRELLSPLYYQTEEEPFEPQPHPLAGKRFIELGAGAGIPSWTAMKCGARVVCTDQRKANRIRCMAECIERNYEQMKLEESPYLEYGLAARACPLSWGKSVDEVTAIEEKFDIIIAADCCYMPWLHDEMLGTIDKLLNDKGAAIVAFCLHGNADDDDVWGIVDRAKAKGFAVEELPATQLTPPGMFMESKQGLVNTLRLTKSSIPN
jgi:hypothetical protein